MKNFVFISPNYPENYWMFVRGLKKHGARVLCIVDTAYENLKPELKANMAECYRVNSFNNYDEMYKAVAYFAFKYGKIDWIESNNEAWLDLDARLRDDFNVKTGYSEKQILEFQSKSEMKKYFKKAGVATAPYILPKNIDEAKKFGKKHGFDLVLKPDHGVGASFTYHIQSEDDLIHYWEQCQGHGQMILEKFVKGDIFTLDGIADEQGKIRFLATMKYISNTMDSVSKHDSIGSYYDFDMPAKQKELAAKVIEAFGIKNRFFHGEYFLLQEDIPGMGKKGDIAGLEINFRTPGGLCPDLINYTYDVDVYDKWANVLLNQEGELNTAANKSAGFMGRRDTISYKYSEQDLRNKYGSEILGIERLPEAFAQAMGNTAIKARFDSAERRDKFYRDAFERCDV